MTVEDEYEQRWKVLERICNRLVTEVRYYLLPNPSIDRVYGRVKSTDQFVLKANRKNPDGSPRYQDPLEEIQDQIGLRVIVKFDEDREPVTGKLMEYLHQVEKAVKTPDEPDQFGYEATHLVCLIPVDLVHEFESPLKFVEVQVCTLFQHAWAEANHDVGYKPGKPLTRDQVRLKALAAAQAWGADRVFSDLRKTLRE